MANTPPSDEKPVKTKTISISQLIELDKERLEEEERFRLDLEADAKKKNIGSLTREEVHDLKKENRFYLPVLNVNHLDHWPPAPLSERKHFTDGVAKETCLSNCCGVPGVKSACCRLDPDDLEHVLGPLDEDWIRKIIKFFARKGLNLKRQDIVIDYEEGVLIGRKFFNSHRVFENKDSYPFMRFQVDGPHFSCKFLNGENGMCNIYSERPDMCRNYLCSYVKSNFLVKTKEHPNRWQAVNLPNKTESSEESK